MSGPADGLSARHVWLALGLAFAVTLAVIVGQRLSPEAMAVLVGVAAGVAAGVPTSLIVVWFASRSLAARLAEQMPRTPAPVAAPEPRIIVVTAAPGPAIAYPAASTPGAVQAAPPRQFTIIGEAALGAAEAPAEVLWHTKFPRVI